MMRNLIVLGCAGLLAIGLSLASFAGSVVDTDLDGVADPDDNCLLAPNGPLLGTDGCVNQEDGDSDGYGNTCDTDPNGDNATTIADVSLTLADSKAAATNPTYDYNCDGATTLADVSRALADSKVGTTPGPSGLSCAGTVTCP